MKDNTLTLELSYEELVIIESLLIDRLDEMKENIELTDEVEYVSEYVRTSSLKGGITGLVDILEANIEYNNDTDDGREE